MKILFLGTGKECEDIVCWTLKKKCEIVGIIGDEEVGQCGIKYSIPILNINDITEDYLSQNKVDLIISYLYNKKIKEPLINFAKYGCINFHPAPLPDYKGRGGCNLAIMHKCKYWGATAHYVNEEFDEGNIIKIFKFDFDYRLETAISLKRKTLKVMNDLYKSVILSIIENGRLSSVQQPSNSGVYLSYKEMLDLMKIDLEKDDIDNKIQAFWFPPYPGAYIEVNNKKYTLINDFILSNIDNHI